MDGNSFVDGDTISSTAPIFVSTVSDPVSNWMSEGLQGTAFVSTHMRQSGSQGICFWFRALGAPSDVSIIYLTQVYEHPTLQAWGHGYKQYSNVVNRVYKIVASNNVIVFTKPCGSGLDTRPVSPGMSVVLLG